MFLSLEVFYGIEVNFVDNRTKFKNTRETTFLEPVTSEPIKEAQQLAWFLKVLYTFLNTSYSWCLWDYDMLSNTEVVEAVM